MENENIEIERGYISDYISDQERERMLPKKITVEETEVEIRERTKGNFFLGKYDFGYEVVQKVINSSSNSPLLLHYINKSRLEGSVWVLYEYFFEDPKKPALRFSWGAWDTPYERHIRVGEVSSEKEAKEKLIARAREVGKDLAAKLTPKFRDLTEGENETYQHNSQ